MQSIRSLLKVRSTDPEETRRRRRSTILLTGAATLSVVTLLAALVASILALGRAEAVLPLTLTGGALLLGSIVLFVRLAAQNLAEALGELRRASKELEAANERLRDLDKLKTSFVARISHELRTPLNAIMGYADMLHQGIYGPLSAQQQDANDRVIANVRHLSGIVDDLLDRAEIQAGTVSIHREHFVPEELVEHLHGTLGALAEAKGLAFDTHVADQVPDLLYGDRRRVEQVLTNLIQNSVKFTEQGSVRIRIYRSGDQYCTFEVADTGPGIPEDARDLVFEPFYQLDDSETREHGGAGLGLSIAKQLAVMMGGEIKLQSEVGRGSTFSVILPLIPPHAQRKDPT